MSKAKKPAAKRDAAKKSKAKVFLVTRTALDVSHATSYHSLHYLTSGDSDRINYVPVRAFTTRKAADEFVTQQDEEVRQTFPPPLIYGHSLAGTDQALSELIRTFGLPACKFGKEIYHHPEQFRKWWKANAKDMSQEQRAALWGPFVAMMIHHIVEEIELEG